MLLCGIVFGLFIIVFLPIEMLHKAEAETWPSRKAVITKSYANHKRGSRNVLYWRPEICGTYMDNGEIFCVTRVRYGGFRFGEGEASALSAVAKYPPGREVDVYYSLENSKETVLEARSSWNEMLILFALGIVFLLLPVCLWLFRKKLEPERYGGK